MPYASCLVSCSVVQRWFCRSACTVVLCLMQLCLSLGTLLNGVLFVWGSWLLQPFLSRVFHIASWDSLSGLCALWDSLSSCPNLWLGRCTLGWPVWPVIGFPMLSDHPNISIVKVIMIGYCCNHLDGQLNCWASAHWLISVTTMYWLCYRWLGHSTIVVRSLMIVVIMLSSFMPFMNCSFNLLSFALYPLHLHLF